MKRKYYAFIKMCTVWFKKSRWKLWIIKHFGNKDTDSK